MKVFAIIKHTNGETSRKNFPSLRAARREACKSIIEEDEDIEEILVYQESGIPDSKEDPISIFSMPSGPSFGPPIETKIR